MFAFVVYALAVWFAAARWRRTWVSFASVAAGGVGLVLVALFHYQLNIWTEGRLYIQVLQVLLYPYAVLVVVMGLYISCLPRGAVVAARVGCPACGYDLKGLESDGLRCPECGMPYEYAVARQIRGIHTGMAVDQPAGPMPAILPNPAGPVSLGRAARRRRPRGPEPVVLRWPATSVRAAHHRPEDG